MEWRCAVVAGAWVLLAGIGCPSPLPAIDHGTDSETSTGAQELTGDATDESTGGEPPGRSCGNGVVEAGESCDASGESAECDVDCTDVVCGDGLLNASAGELCDGTDLNEQTCATQRAGAGTLSCTAECTYDTSQCYLGSFIPVDVQRFDLGFGMIKEIIVADVDGDGFDDLVYNRRDAQNDTIVLFSSDSGMLTAGPAVDNTEAANWSRHKLRAGDLDGDGDDDLVWNDNTEDCNPDRKACRDNAYYVGLSNGRGGFDMLPRQFESIGDDSSVSNPFLILDLNGDGMQEPITAFGLAMGGGFRTRPTVSEGGGALRLADLYEMFPTDNIHGEGHGVESPLFLGDFTGDFNGDGSPDILWNRLVPTGDETGPLNRIRLVTIEEPISGLSPARVPLDAVFEESLGKADIAQPPTGRWDDGYVVLAGDVDISGADDLVWVRIEDGTAHLQVALGSPLGLQDVGLSSSSTPLPNKPTSSTFTLLLADVGGNDGDDLIISNRSVTNEDLFIGLHQPGGTLTFVEIDLGPLVATDPRGLDQFELHVGNFGGSSKQDLAWVSKTQMTDIIIALAN